jgi:hypothetical protein
MLFVLALPIFLAVASLHRYLALNAPSNILIRRVRSAPPRWRTAAALAALTVGLILLMRVVEIGIGAGGPGWLNVVALVLAWDAIKFATLAVATGLRATLGRHPHGTHEVIHAVRHSCPGT